MKRQLTNKSAYEDVSAYRAALRTITPLLLSAEAAAKLVGVGRTHFYGMHGSGRLGPLPVRLGKRTLWRRAELEEWVESGCPSREKWQARTEKKF